MHDPQRRFVFRGGTQRGHELLLVRIGRGQPEHAVLVARARSARRPAAEPTSASSPIRSQVDASSARALDSAAVVFSQRNLVARVRNRICLAVLVVLCGKLCQHVHVCCSSPARRVERASSSIRPSSSSRTVSVVDGDGVVVRRLPIVPVPVLAMLERIGGQVELSRRPVPDRLEVGQVAQDVRVGQRLR